MQLPNRVALLWRFLGFFQKPFLRALHATVAVLILFQLFGGLGVSPHVYGLPFGESFVLWGHGLSGLLILTLSIVLVVVCFATNGLFHYFPYAFGDFSQIRRDLADTLHFRLVAPRAAGLANAVQGLGMCALLLTALSGASWLFFRWLGLFEGWLLGVHSFAATLLALYFIGHGGMALLHFRLWLRKTGSGR